MVNTKLLTPFPACPVGFSNQWVTLYPRSSGARRTGNPNTEEWCSGQVGRSARTAQPDSRGRPRPRSVLSPPWLRPLREIRLPRPAQAQNAERYEKANQQDGQLGKSAAAIRRNVKHRFYEVHPGLSSARTAFSAVRAFPLLIVLVCLGVLPVVVLTVVVFTMMVLPVVMLLVALFVHLPALPSFALLAAFPVVILAALAVMFPAFTAAAALQAALLTTAECPCDHLHFPLGGMRIVALDHQLTRRRLTLRGFVPDHYVQARARVQRCRERIVDEPPVPAPMLERDLRHMQVAVSHIADSDGAEGAPAALHSAEVRRPGNRDLPRRRIPGHRDRLRTARVVAGHGDGSPIWVRSSPAGIAAELRATRRPPPSTDTRAPPEPRTRPMTRRCW